MGVYNGSFKAACIDDEKLYVIDRFVPILIVYNLTDLSKFKILTYKVMPYECMSNQIVSMKKEKDNIYIILDGRLNYLIVYNILNERYTEYSIDDSKERVEIMNSYFDDGNIYIFPTELNKEISIFKTDNKSFLNNVKLNWKEPVSSKRHNVLYGRIFAYHDDYYVFPATYNYAVKFSANGEEIKRYKISEDIEIENVAFYGESFYISSYKDNILREWNYNRNTIREYALPVFESSSKSILNIANIYTDENTIVCIPYKGGKISFIDRKNNNKQIIDLSGHCMPIYNFSNRLFNFGGVFENRLLLLPNIADCFVWIDLLTGRYERVNENLMQKDVEAAFILMKNYNDPSMINEEKNKQSLESFLKAIQYA